MNISIIIPNFNGEKYLSKCIDALYKQSYRDFEIIIVDNASSDESCMIISSRYPNIKLIKLDKNFGFSKAVNEGIKSAKGEYVVLLNNDTEVKEHWLENLIICIEKDPKIFSCSSKMIRYTEKDKIDDAGDGYTLLGWAYKRGDGAAVSKYTKNSSIFSSCAGAAIYRKKIFEEIGYFDENFFAYMEDVDIGYRALLHGYKNIYCSSAEVYHIGSATSGSRHNAFKVKLAARNNIYVILKNMPLLQIIINLPFLLIGFIIKYIFFRKKALGREYLQGIKEAFKNRKNIKRVEYSNKNLLNYFKVQLLLIGNTIKLVSSAKFLLRLRKNSP